MFERQHTLFKWIFSLFCLVIIIISSPLEFAAISIVMTCYLLFSPQLLLHWMKSIMIIIPLIITMLIFAVFSENNFYYELLVIARIILMLQLSVILIKTSNPTDLFNFLPKSLNKLKIFFTATVLFIPIMVECHKKAANSSNKPLEIFKAALNFTSEKIDFVRKQIEDTRCHPTIEYDWKADLSGFIVLVIISLIYFI